MNAMKSGKFILGTAAALVALTAVSIFNISGGANLAHAALSRAERAKQEAEFINNFLSFVDWPGKAFYDDKAPAVLCVVGNNPFGKSLQKYAAGKDGPRPLAVVDLESVAQVPACHMVFIEASEKARAAEIMESVGDSAVLTLSEIEGFATSGGMIEFSDDGRGVRLTVNQKTAQDAGFKISSKLLRVATIVGQ